MKIIFAGTTEFAIPSLEQLKSKHDIALVITQPDRPVGRNRVLTPPPIKFWAQKNNLTVAQPEKISLVREQISALRPDVMLVAAYGEIIPQDILDIPKKGSVNIHGSILPFYRGPSPIQSALLNGETTTGITYILMDNQMDHGPILATRRIAIDDSDTYSTLYKKLSDLAGNDTADVLERWIKDEIKPNPQDHTRATYTKMLTHKDGRIDWTKPARNIYNQIRALNPEPGTWTTINDKSVKILEATLLNHNKIELPGKIYREGKNLAVKCADASLLIKTVQPEGKKSMSGNDFLNGLGNLGNKIFV